MINNYYLAFIKKMCVVLLGMIINTALFGQSTTIGTTTTFLNNNGTGTNTFNFQNTNPYPVIITGIDGVVSNAVANTCQVWYKTTPLTTLPGAISNANGWFLAMSGVFTGVANSTTTVTQPFITNGNFVIPGNTTYALAITAFSNASTPATAQRYYSIPASTPATVYGSGGGCNMIFSSAYSYGGGIPPAAPGNGSRGWIGRITFVPALSGYNNAGVSNLIAPQKFCNLTQALSVRVKNKGKNVIDSVSVEWDIDNTPQAPFMLRIALDTAGGTGSNDTVVSLGNITFAPNTAKQIRVWTSMPNSVQDTINSDDTLYVTLRPGLNGTYTISPSAADYPSVEAAITDLNRFGICGAVTFNVDAGTTYTSNPAILSQTGTATNPIVFQKSGVGANPIIYGKNGVGTQDAVIALNGVSYVTFDGIDAMDSISNASVSTQMEYGYGIVNSSPTTGSTNNIIRNSRIVLRRTNTTSIGLVQSTLVPATALSGANHNNRYENIRVENSYSGIALFGTAAFPDSSNIITSTGTDTTIVGALTAGDIGGGTAVVTGINLTEQRNLTVSKCVVRNLLYTSTSVSQGIWLSNSNAASNYGTALIFNNQVYGINRSSTSATGTIMGMRIDVAALASVRVYNNIIHSIISGNTAAAAATTQTIRGISHGHTTGTGSGEYYYNSIYLNNTNVNPSVVSFWKGGTSAVTAKNNIFNTTCVAQTGNPKHFAVYLNGGSINGSNNILFSSPTTNGFTGYAGATDRLTLPLFAAATSATAPADGNEQGSTWANPNFAATDNLSFTSATPASSSGVPITSPAINTDITGALRHSTNPTIGAIETSQTLQDSTAPVIRNIIANSGSLPVIYATIIDNNTTQPAAGSVQLWYRAGTSGIFTALNPDSIPASNMNGTYKWGASLSALATGSYQFYIAARDMVGSGLNIAVNPIQSLSFTGFSATDPVNYANNPDAGANVRTFAKNATLAGGVYTVGPTGNYLTLTAAAAALNVADLTGNIVFELQPAYTSASETFPITFNRFTTSGGNWTATIVPAAGATGLTITGAHATATIDLNGVRNLYINGRAGYTGAQVLSISNTSATGAAIRLINNAQNNRLSNLVLTGANTSATGGVVVFGNTSGTTASDGNSDNVIDSCSINGGNTSVNCLYSAGSAAPADNKNNTITNSRIFDFFSNVASGSSSGIFLDAGNTGWTIGTAGNGNSFYHTSAKSNTSTPVLSNAVNFKAIQINNTGNGFNITGNRIGGNIAGIPGSVFSFGDNSSVGITLRCIDIVAVGTTTPTSVQGNTVSDISVYSTVSNFFAGVYAGTGAINTGNITGNIIGSATGNGSISTYSLGTTSLANVYGIRYSSTTGVIQNNVVGSFTAEQKNASGNIQVLCIYVSGSPTSPLVISNNVVGSLVTPHSVQNVSTSIGGANVMGLVASAATASQIIFTNNTVSNVSNLSTFSGTNNGVKGIYITGASSVGTTISNNTISKLYSMSTNLSVDQSSSVVGINTTSSGAGSQTISGNTIHSLVSGVTSLNTLNVVGIYYGSTTTGTTNIIERNTINRLSAAAANSNALISGITQGVGTTRLSIVNNMISLGYDSSGAVSTGAHLITGIQKTAGSFNTTAYNTVAIGGSGVASGTANSFAYRSAAIGVDTLVNNIFVNTRSNSASGGNHYAISLNGNTTLTINRNLYFSAGIFGSYNATDRFSLTDWRISTGQDLQSVNTNVTFVSLTDLHLSGASLGDFTLAGMPLPAYTMDFDQQTRHAVFPYMGADENTPSLPVVLNAISANQINAEDIQLNWTTAQEINSQVFEIEKSADGVEFIFADRVKAAGNSNTLLGYFFIDKQAATQNIGVVYYRLKMIDMDGSFSYSTTVSVNLNKGITFGLAAVSPNPFTHSLSLHITAPASTQVTWILTDIHGKMVLENSKEIKAGNHQIDIQVPSTVQPGIYFMRVSDTTGNSRVIKLTR